MSEAGTSKTEDKRVSALEGLGMSVVACLARKTPTRYAIYRNAADGRDAGRFHLVAAPVPTAAPERMTAGAGWDPSQDYRLIGYLTPPSPPAPRVLRLAGADSEMRTLVELAAKLPAPAPPLLEHPPLPPLPPLLHKNGWPITKNRTQRLARIERLLERRRSWAPPSEEERRVLRNKRKARKKGR